MIGGYNPIKWSKSGTFLITDQSFIFSFDTTLESVILSRVKDSNHAISDSSSTHVGFGCGDLHIFRKCCKLTNYSVKILDSDTFDVADYEVFQVIEK